MTKTMIDLQLSAIDVPKDRARDFDPDAAALLAGTIAAQGLFHPIRVRVDGARYRLIAGRNRLEAFRLLGRESIPATISDAASDDEARLEEVMENLGRAELIALDRCHHLYELKEVWLRMYPTSSVGGGKWAAPHAVTIGPSIVTGGKSFPTIKDDPEIFGFSTICSTKFGLSKRAINIAVKIWSDLTPDSRTRLTGTPWAAKQSEIQLLSCQDHKHQAIILDLLLAQNAKVSSVADAIGTRNNGMMFNDVEQKFIAANKIFAKLKDPVIDRLVEANEVAIIASLKRLGRI
jgi:ParB family chromosome partitioning protein